MANFIRPVALLLIAATTACGDDDDTSDTTVPAASAELCDAAFQVFDIAVQAWHAQYGNDSQPTLADLVAEQFIADEGELSDDALEGLVVIAGGEAQPGPACT